MFSFVHGYQPILIQTFSIKISTGGSNIEIQLSTDMKSVGFNSKYTLNIAANVCLSTTSCQFLLLERLKLKSELLINTTTKNLLRDVCNRPQRRAGIPTALVNTLD